MYIYGKLKAIMQSKTQEKVGREDFCCFAIHGRSLLIPTNSMAVLFKPKLTCSPGSEVSYDYSSDSSELIPH